MRCVCCHAACQASCMPDQRRSLTSDLINLTRLSHPRAHCVVSAISFPSGTQPAAHTPAAQQIAYYTHSHAQASGVARAMLAAAGYGAKAAAKGRAALCHPARHGVRYAAAPAARRVRMRALPVPTQDVIDSSESQTLMTLEERFRMADLDGCADCVLACVSGRCTGGQLVRDMQFRRGGTRARRACVCAVRVLQQRAHRPGGAQGAVGVCGGRAVVPAYGGRGAHRQRGTTCAWVLWRC